ncbi:DUF1918 domain-containing protein [Pseudonocardia saturnea]
MIAQQGDWMLPASGESHSRRGQLVALKHPDGSPPFRVRWLEDEVSVVFPPPDAHLESPHAAPRS